MPRKRKVTPEMREEMRRRRPFETLLNLAVDFGVEAPAVYYHTKGIEGPGRWSRPKIDVPKVQRLIAQGVPKSVIAARLKVSKPGIWQALKRHALREN